MKAKKAGQTFICVLAVVLIVSLTACENNPSRDNETSFTVSTASDTDDSKFSAYPEETQASSAKTEFEQKSTYYHAAICGVVVTEQDGSPRFTYVKKCENCGKIQSGSNTTNATGGVLHGSFLCSGCRETQQFEIETTQN